MITCLAIPSFALRVALRHRPDLRGRPVALAPMPGEQPLVGACTVNAAIVGVRSEMRLSEALASCPDLQLVEQNPVDEEECWEQILRRLESAGFAVEPVEPGCAYFETKGIERLAGGFQETLCRALDTVGLFWEPRLGVASRRFTALAAASVASSGKALVVDNDEAELFLEPLPFDLLPLPLEHRMELSALGVDMSGSNAIEA